MDRSVLRMLRRAVRVASVVALLLVATVPVASSAGGIGAAGGTAVVHCNFWKGDLRTNPGLVNGPADAQNATLSGRVYGCDKAGGSANVSATLTMTSATCAAFSMQGTGQFAWANGQSSSATLVLQQQDFAPQKYLVGGAVTAGSYRNLLIHSYLRFTLVNKQTGEALCTAENPAVKAEYRNSASLQLLTPDTPPTSVSPPPPPPPPTTSSTLAPVRPTISPTSVGPKGPLPYTGVGMWGPASGVAALVAGGGLGLLGSRRRSRRRTPQRIGARRWLEITLPPE